jgi:hypothetical protein
MSYVDEPQTAPVSYRAKSKFCEGFKTGRMRGVAFMGSVPALWVHAGDMCEPLERAAVVLSITGWPRKSNARLSALVRETAGRESIRKLTRGCYWSLEYVFKDSTTFIRPSMCPQLL